MTAFWYPGFLPANAFVVTADCLVWTIDHLPLASPGSGAARHFVDVFKVTKAHMTLRRTEPALKCSGT